MSLLAEIGIYFSSSNFFRRKGGEIRRMISPTIKGTNVEKVFANI